MPPIVPKPKSNEDKEAFDIFNRAYQMGNGERYSFPKYTCLYECNIQYKVEYTSKDSWRRSADTILEVGGVIVWAGSYVYIKIKKPSTFVKDLLSGASDAVALISACYSVYKRFANPIPTGVYNVATITYYDYPNHHPTTEVYYYYTTDTDMCMIYKY